MAKPRMHTDFVRKVKVTPTEAPFSLLPAQIPESSGPYAYPLRKTTVATTVKLYRPILEAIRMFVRTENTLLSVPYMMIAQKVMGSKGAITTRHYLETIDEDGDTLLFEAMNDTVRISKIAASDDEDRNPLVAFAQQTNHQINMVTLAVLPRILQIDKEQADSKLTDVVLALGMELETAADWTDATDIPDLTKEHLYYTDAAIYALDKVELDFGDSSSSAPEEVDASVFQRTTKLRGAEVCKNLTNGWAPRFIESDGTKVQQAAKVLTVGLAKQEFASFSANRNWTPMEKMLIPSFPDDMPVMPEVLRMANRICQTSHDTNPVRNVMWRSDTGFGKSTGTRQLACILNAPHLVMTCHPGMEVQEFKSNFVPSTADGIDLDMTSVTAPAVEENQTDRPPFFAESMAFVATLDEQQRVELFDAKRFYCDVMVEDTEVLAETIIGSKKDISVDDLCWLYAEVRSAFLREDPLRKKVKQLEAAVDAVPVEKKGDKPEFVHVVSNYVKAMVNGYICEIQEASRIRDSGVLVGLNEFDRPGAVIPLMNGALARRHKDAVCIITDNVGYNSCRPIDPSVLRRQGFIIDSVDLTKEQLLDRVKRNTMCNDKTLLDMAYNYWHTVKEYCEQNSITEGSVSPMELERFVQALMYDGLDCLETDLDDCIISKATSSIEDQKGIRTACQTAIAA